MQYNVPLVLVKIPNVSQVRTKLYFREKGDGDQKLEINLEGLNGNKIKVRLFTRSLL